MDPHAQLSQTITQTLEAAERALQSDAAEAYEHLSERIRGLGDTARETFQGTQRARYEAIVAKLERAQPLTAEEAEALERLIVGDAEHYLRIENNFHDWQAELRRLVGQLDAMRSFPLDRPESQLRVQALCTDARGVLPDIVHYLRERERLERLRQVIRGRIAPDEGRRLAGIVRDMLASERR